jgi:3-oxoacyl-[acyl-carrier protein] reductase
MVRSRFAGIQGRVAVVTGAARGIGRAIAEAMADHGARVAGFDVQLPEDATASPIHFIRCDVSDERDVDAAFSQVEAELGAVGILVNNAAILRHATVEETSLDLWRHVLDVNLTGAFLASRRALPGMRQAGYGRIVNIGSNSGKTGGSSSVVAYAASKAALHNLARSIAAEQAANGITANAIAACLIDTDMAADIRGYLDRVPVGRMGTVDDVAYATLFLASSEASYITGEVMDVNGGYLID